MLFFQSIHQHGQTLEETAGREYRRQEGPQETGRDCHILLETRRNF